MTKNAKNMSVREYNEMLVKQSNLNESEMHSRIRIYSDADFNKRTVEHWGEFEGLCREPSAEEVTVWRSRNGK